MTNSETYYLIEPKETGSGGCCGEIIHDEGELSYLIGKNPYRDYEIFRYCHPFNMHPRICLEKDIDKAVFYWDDLVCKWVK